jgi:hypothetical protein
MREALAAYQYDYNENEANPELPILRRYISKGVLQYFEDDGAEQPTVEVADAADNEY